MQHAYSSKKQVTGEHVYKLDLHATEIAIEVKQAASACLHLSGQHAALFKLT